MKWLIDFQSLSNFQGGCSGKLPKQVEKNDLDLWL